MKIKPTLFGFSGEPGMRQFLPWNPPKRILTRFFITINSVEKKDAAWIQKLKS